jgi:hypothetical protein
MTGCDIGFIALDLVGQRHWRLFFTRLLLDSRDMELSSDDSWTTLEHKTPESNKSARLLSFSLP